MASNVLKLIEAVLVWVLRRTTDETTTVVVARRGTVDLSRLAQPHKGRVHVLEPMALDLTDLHKQAVDDFEVVRTDGEVKRRLTCLVEIAGLKQ